MQHNQTNSNSLDIAVTGLMAALVFVGTYFFKIPTAFGYIHLGDCMILLTVYLFGSKRGVLAGVIGAGLSDFISGYMIWVIPTIIMKIVFAFVTGYIMYQLLPKYHYSWFLGAVIGGIFHTLGYILINMIFYGVGTAAVEFLPNSIQSAAGIMISSILYIALKKNPAVSELKNRLK